MSRGQASLITTTPDTEDAHRAMCSELQENTPRVSPLRCLFQLHTRRFTRQHVWLDWEQVKKRNVHAVVWKTSPDMSESHRDTEPHQTSIHIWGISAARFMQWLRELLIITAIWMKTENLTLRNISYCLSECFGAWQFCKHLFTIKNT